MMKGRSCFRPAPQLFGFLLFLFLQQVPAQEQEEGFTTTLEVVAPRIGENLPCVQNLNAVETASPEASTSTARRGRDASPLVCYDGDLYSIEYDGPSKGPTTLTSPINMILKAPTGKAIMNNGSFRVQLSLVTLDATQPESDEDIGITDSTPSEGCNVTLDGKSVDAFNPGSSVACGEMWIQTFPNDQGTYVCRLMYTANVVSPSVTRRVFHQVALTVDIPDNVLADWERMCGSEAKTYTYNERYYYTGLDTYNHDRAVLEIVDSIATAAPDAATNNVTVPPTEAVTFISTTAADISGVSTDVDENLSASPETTTSGSSLVAGTSWWRTSFTVLPGIFGAVWFA